MLSDIIHVNVYDVKVFSVFIPGDGGIRASKTPSRVLGLRIRSVLSPYPDGESNVTAGDP